MKENLLRESMREFFNDLINFAISRQEEFLEFVQGKRDQEEKQNGSK